MKILAVTNDFPPRIGGINDYVAQILARFPPGEVVVFASSWPGAAEYDRTFPHPVIRWPHRTLLPTPAALARLCQIVRSERPSVVLYGAAFPFALMGPPVHRRLGVPYAAFTHGLEVAAARLPLARAALAWIGRHAALLTAVSAWTESVLRPVMGSRFERLPVGVDVARFRPDVPTDHLRARHRLGAGPVITCVSRLVPRKGQDQLIRGLPRILTEFPSARLLVVGSGPDERRLRALARRHDVAGQVVFAGAVPYRELPAYFRVGDVFAMPSRSRFLGLEVEALGSVYLQAAAVGRASVGGDTGGVRDAVQDGTTGVLVDGRNVAAIGDAVLGLLEEPERARRMGAEGAEWILRELTWDLVSARLRRLLSGVSDRAAV